MNDSLITSVANPIVKQARALREHKVRVETSLFLVEGIHHVGEAIQAGWKIESILYAPEILKSDFAKGLISHFPAVARAVSAQVFDSLASKENPQGILAIVHQNQTRLADFKSSSFGTALVAPQDPGNIGAILRTLDAVGGNALFLLDGGADPYNNISVRASMGALFWVPIFQLPFAELIPWAHEHKAQLIGTSAHAGLHYKESVIDHPWLLIMGSEQKGLSAEQLADCDISVSIPMNGRASSLNLAVAAGILLYEFVHKD